MSKRRVAYPHPLQSLTVARPDLAAQWHPTRNGDLTPDQVTVGSGLRAWWQCRAVEEHVWNAIVQGRTNSAGECPFCAGRRVSHTSSLAARFPDLAAQWHPSQNGDLTPEDIVPGSNDRVWWKCPRGDDHEWRAATKDRARDGKGCPFCSGRRASAEISLAVCNPAIAAQWHPTRNGDLTPHQVRPMSNLRAWWQCPRNSEHVWFAVIGSRTGQGVGCPFCAGQRLVPEKSLAHLHPELAQQWHPTLNGELTPDQVADGSSHKVWWQCPKDLSHAYAATVSHRTSLGTGCPYCRGLRVNASNSLARIHPGLAQEWHPTLNGEMTPNDVVSGSNTIVWWICPVGADHVWQASPSHRTLVSSGCPFCASKRVSITNSLAQRYPEVAAEWHPMRNGTLTPDQVVAGNHGTAWWRCAAGPDHEWQARIDNRTREGGHCPYCAGRRLSITKACAAALCTARRALTATSTTAKSASGFGARRNPVNSSGAGQPRISARTRFLMAPIIDLTRPSSLSTWRVGSPAR